MTSKQKQEEEKQRVKPTVNLMPKWELEEACFKNAKIKDVRTGKEGTWPREKPVAQIAYEQNFLDKVLDPDTGEYYPKRDEEGKPIKTISNPKHTINTIIRVKRADNTEFLVSKGNLVGYDSLGDEVKFYASMPEKWMRTGFQYDKDWDPKRKAIVKHCKGPSSFEEVYSLEFNESNLKSLFDKRESDHIQWIVKQEQSGTAKQVATEPELNINDTFKLFLKPFDYLYNGEYITPLQKADMRRMAEDQGLIPRQSNAIEYRRERAADQLEANKKGMYL